MVVRDGYGMVRVVKVDWWLVGGEFGQGRNIVVDIGGSQNAPCFFYHQYLCVIMMMMRTIRNTPLYGLRYPHK